MVVGLGGKVLVRGGRGGLCEKLPAAAPMSHRAHGSGSGTDPPLAEAEPGSRGGSASGGL